MVIFNYSQKEVTIKIVYYGPGLCGKTTNLKFIYDTLPSNSKSKMISLATNQDRTLFFDFLPLELGTIRGMKLRLQLYTVPGQVYYNSTRKLVLKGADGVVFVADSQDFTYDANIESLRNLRENLSGHGMALDKIPYVFQYNKRDLPNLISVETLNEILNREDKAHFESIATTGFNVLETLKTITKDVLEDVIQQHGLMPGDTLTLEEIDFGMTSGKSKRRVTMMDFDETPDSVWEDDIEGEEGAASDEFIFEEVPDAAGTQAEQDSAVSPGEPEEPDKETGTSPSKEGEGVEMVEEPLLMSQGKRGGEEDSIIEYKEEVVSSEEIQSQVLPSEEPAVEPTEPPEMRPASLEGFAKPDTGIPGIENEGIVEESLTPVRETPAQEEMQEPPLSEVPAAEVDREDVSPPEEMQIIHESIGQSLEPALEEKSSPPEKEGEAGAVLTEPEASVREIPVDVILTPEEIKTGAFRIILNVKVKP